MVWQGREASQVKSEIRWPRRPTPEDVPFGWPAIGVEKHQELHRNGAQHWHHWNARSGANWQPSMQSRERTSARERHWETEEKKCGKQECRRRKHRLIGLCDHGKKALCNGYFPSALPESICPILHPALTLGDWPLWTRSVAPLSSGFWLSSVNVGHQQETRLQEEREGRYWEGRYLFTSSFSF